MEHPTLYNEGRTGMVAGSAGKSLKISELDYYFSAILCCQPFSSAGFQV